MRFWHDDTYLYSSSLVPKLSQESRLNVQSHLQLHSVFWTKTRINAKKKNKNQQNKSSVVTRMNQQDVITPFLPLMQPISFFSPKKNKSPLFNHRSIFTEDYGAELWSGLQTVFSPTHGNQDEQQSNSWRPLCTETSPLPSRRHCC